MENVTVDKNNLLTVLRENRDAHRAIFEEAVDGYKAKVLAELEKHLERVKAGKQYAVFVSLPEPEDHTKDYDRAIRMIEMSVEDTVTLTERDFQSYVMDDWQWKRQFLTSNASYSSTAAASL